MGYQWKPWAVYSRGFDPYDLELIEMFALERYSHHKPQTVEGGGDK